MAVTSSTTNATTTNYYASGAYLDSAASPDAASITVGFTPKHIIVENLTDRIRLEFFDGMTSTHALKTIAAGTRSAETSGGITVSGGTFSFAVTQNKQYYWSVQG